MEILRYWVADRFYLPCHLCFASFLSRFDAPIEILRRP